jgi:benzoyl-CoA reductase subunit BamC
VARIKVDHDKCTGCRLCELACSLHHIENTFNPKRSRIKVFIEGELHYPVLAGPYTDAECTAKNMVVIAGHEYDECVLCRASCPAKPIFKEPDTEVPLKCDFCGDPPDPQCVKVCVPGALTFLPED